METYKSVKNIRCPKCGNYTAEAVRVDDLDKFYFMGYNCRSCGYVEKIQKEKNKMLTLWGYDNGKCPRSNGKNKRKKKS